MARDFDNNGGLVSALAPAATNYPLTFACWFLRDGSLNLTGADMAISISEVAGLERLEMKIRTPAQAQVRVTARDALAASSATVGTYTADTWFPMVAVFPDKDNRTIYFEGDSDTVAAERIMTSLDTLCLGVRANENTTGEALTGSLAKCCVWNVALTDSEAQTINSGFDLKRVRRDSIIHYYDLFETGTQSGRDIFGELPTVHQGNAVNLSVGEPPVRGFRQ